MAPAILNLEISRLGRLLPEVAGRTGVYNALVKTRYELRQFVQLIENSEGVSPPEQAPTSLPGQAREHLSAAVLALALAAEQMDAETRRTAAYVLERLRHVEERIDLIY